MHQKLDDILGWDFSNHHEKCVLEFQNLSESPARTAARNKMTF